MALTVAALPAAAAKRMLSVAMPSKAWMPPGRPSGFLMPGRLPSAGRTTNSFLHGSNSSTRGASQVVAALKSHPVVYHPDFQISPLPEGHRSGASADHEPRSASSPFVWKPQARYIMLV